MSLRVLVQGFRPRVTVRYPLEPHPTPPDFRGKVEIDPSACMGCGACVAACPPNALEMIDDLDSGVRVIRLFYGRCIFCGRCEEACPRFAVEQSSEFELATRSRERLVMEVVHRLAQCPRGHYAPFTERQVREALEILRLAMNSELAESLRDTVRTCIDHRREEVVERVVRALKPGEAREALR